MARRFDPARDIANCALWYDFADPASLELQYASGQGTVITKVKDKSGNQRDALGGTPNPDDKGLWVRGVRNGLGACRLGDTWRNMVLPSLSTFSEGSVLVAFVKDVDDDGSGLWKMGTSGSACHHCWTDQHLLDDWGSTTRKDCGNPTPSFTNWTLYAVRSKTNQWDSHINTEQLFSTTTNTVGFSSTPKLGRQQPTSDWSLIGYVGELVIFDRYLANSDLNRAGLYLCEKWGIGPFVGLSG